MRLLCLFVAVCTLALVRSQQNQITLGSGGVQAVDFYTCHFSGDPHAKNWNGQRGPFPFPCNFKAATLLVKTRQEKTYMEVRVVAASSMDTKRGRYFINHLEVELVLKNGTDTDKLTDGPSATFTVSDDRISSGGHNNPPTVWDVADPGGIGGTVEIGYHPGTRLAFLRLKFAQVRIQFRPAKKHGSIRQTPLPGLFIMVGKKQTLYPISDDMALFPNAICSEIDDFRTFSELQANQSLTSSTQLLLWAALGQDVPQTNAVCNNATDGLKACVDQEAKAAAMRACEQYTKHETVKRLDCAHGPGGGFKAFSFCIQSSCGIPHTRRQLRRLFNKPAPPGCRQAQH